MNELSKRQGEVLELIAMGQSNKQISRSLGIELESVKTHIKYLYLKLGATSRVHAIRIGLTKGILSPKSLKEVA